MYVYLGGDAVIREQDVIGIFDLDNTTVSKHTRDYLSAAEKSGMVKTITWDIPKAFVVCQQPKKRQKLRQIQKKATSFAKPLTQPNEQAKSRRQAVFLTQMAPATLRKRAALGEKE